MLSAERRARILKILTAEGRVRVAELSRLLQVSEVTVRNDLSTLAREGLAIRDHGGAIARTHTALSAAFEQRALHRQPEKQRIGQAAAALVQPGETILLDAGTTTMEMARALQELPGLTVVTNAINIAAHIGALPAVHVFLPGGSLSRQTLSTLGAMAERDLGDLMVDKLFLGAHAFDAEAGITDLSIEIARVKQVMIRSAKQVILLADSSKWGKSAFARVAPLQAVHLLISDTQFTGTSAMEACGLKVQLV